MPLLKKYLKTKPWCKVRFDLPAEDLPKAQKVELLGSFSNWQPIAMRKTQGRYTRSIDLERGADYEFRYRVNGHQWLNDSEADDYRNSGLFSENSVLRLS